MVNAVRAWALPDRGDEPGAAGEGTLMAWHTPNAMLAAAREHMLDGREPESERDWAMVMNFLARNIDPACAQPACLVMARLYAMPLSEQEVTEIVDFQLAAARKREMSNCPQ